MRGSLAHARRPSTGAAGLGAGGLQRGAAGDGLMRRRLLSSRLGLGVNSRRSLTVAPQPRVLLGQRVQHTLARAVPWPRIALHTVA